MTQAVLVAGVILEILSIGLAVGLWRGQERLASKVFWTAIVLVPFFGAVAFSVWHDPPGPSDPIDRPAEREWDLPPPPRT